MPKQMLSSWVSQLHVARKLHDRWQTLERSGQCSSRAGSLCGANAAVAEAGESEEAIAEILGSPLDYDSRNKVHTGGFNYVNSPLDQGTCNACVAFSLTSAAETAISIELAVDAPDLPRLSPKDLFFCSPTSTKVSCNVGWTIEEALDGLVKRSMIAKEACVPWAASDAQPMDGSAGELIDWGRTHASVVLWLIILVPPRSVPRILTAAEDSPIPSLLITYRLLHNSPSSFQTRASPYRAAPTAMFRKGASIGAARKRWTPIQRCACVHAVCCVLQAGLAWHRVPITTSFLSPTRGSHPAPS